MRDVVDSACKDATPTYDCSNGYLSNNTVYYTDVDALWH